MSTGVSVPTVGGVKGAFGDAAWGGVAGAAFGLITSLFGNSLLGILAGVVVSGAALKGARGQAVASVLGFLLAASMFGGGGGSQSQDAGVM